MKDNLKEKDKSLNMKSYFLKKCPLTSNCCLSMTFPRYSMMSVSGSRVLPALRIFLCFCTRVTCPNCSYKMTNYANVSRQRIQWNVHYLFFIGRTALYCTWWVTQKHTGLFVEWQTCIREPSTVWLQASSVWLMVSTASYEVWICAAEGDVVVLPSDLKAVVQAARCTCSNVCTSALYWFVIASSYWSVHWRILLSHPSAVFSSSTLASIAEF